MTYEELFKDRVIYITGAGRSGTTIMGKVLGSMRPAHYLFEPFMLRTLVDHGDFLDPDAFRQNLFEDFLLPTIQCRSINWHKTDDTYWGNYMTHDDVQRAWNDLPRREDVIKYIKRERPYFIIKNPEAQPVMHELCEIFPGVQFVHMLRNGIDVVTSAMKQGWYTDEYCAYQGCSFWVDDEALEYFDDYNPVTKAACVWRCLNDTFIRKRVGMGALNIKYEQLASHPEQITDQLEMFYGLRSQPITRMHIEDIKNFKRNTSTPTVTADEIQEPERTLFAEAMGRYGY